MGDVYLSVHGSAGTSSFRQLNMRYYVCAVGVFGTTLDSDLKYDLFMMIHIVE